MHRCKGFLGRSNRLDTTPAFCRRHKDCIQVANGGNSTNLVSRAASNSGTATTASTSIQGFDIFRTKTAGSPRAICIVRYAYNSKSADPRKLPAPPPIQQYRYWIAQTPAHTGPP